jgi:hypothetical protein
VLKRAVQKQQEKFLFAPQEASLAPKIIKAETTMDHYQNIGPGSY